MFTSILEHYSCITLILECFVMILRLDINDNILEFNINDKFIYFTILFILLSLFLLFTFTL